MRSRNVKPGFFKNEDLAENDSFGRILFIGLWCLADREGRLEDRPKRIKAEILPYDEVDIAVLLTALQATGFVTRYSADGKSYIQINNFHKHQNPHVKEQASTIPAPDISGASTIPAPDKPGSCPSDSLLLIPDSCKELSASGDADLFDEGEDEGISEEPEPELITRKDRKLTGWKLETFNQFWDAFDYKKGKAEAADAWFEIKGLTEAVTEKIITCARREAKRRPSLIQKGGTPKWAQGWLSGRRWEDEDLKNPVTLASDRSEYVKRHICGEPAKRSSV